MKSVQSPHSFMIIPFLKLQSFTEYFNETFYDFDVKQRRILFDTLSTRYLLNI